jgi:hypothetical protein
MKTNIPKQNIEALRIIIDAIKDMNLRWALVGSTALAIHGVGVEVHDIDINTDPKSICQIGELLKEYVIEPVHYKETEKFKSIYGLFNIFGVQVEIFTDLECHTDGIWQKISNPHKIIMKEYEGIRIPLIDLREEYEAYKKLGRIDKANKILEVLEK